VFQERFRLGSGKVQLTSHLHLTHANRYGRVAWNSIGQTFGVIYMKLLYIMDPMESMHPLKDTTFAFMRAASAAGHQNYHCLMHQLSIRHGRLFAHAAQAWVSEESAPHTRLAERSMVAVGDMDAVLIRKDPPFHVEYLHTTRMLELERENTLIINDPRALRDANEKLFALNFRSWMPETIVSSNRQEIRQFLKEMGGKAVIKPLDGAGGAGVMMLQQGDKNVPAIIDSLTHEGTDWCMVQAFLPDVTVGDKRVLLLDGELLGAILRVPQQDDLRSNIHVGGSVVPTELTKRELELVEDLGPKLRKVGLYFVGLDVIGEHLTEVNVTSPTGIQELARFTNSQPEHKVIEWIQARVQSSS
jgi:glutathione synthase